MEIPEVFLGTSVEVRRRLNAMFKRIKRDQDWSLLEKSELILGSPDTRVLFDPERATASEVHFRLYQAPKSFNYRFPPNLGEDIEFFFDYLVKSPWGVLILICQESMIPNPKQDPERHRVFFRSFVQYSPTYESSKDLFQVKTRPPLAGPYFWQNTITRLFSQMVKSGLPRDYFQKHPLSQFTLESIRQLIKEYILKE